MEFGGWDVLVQERKTVHPLATTSQMQAYTEHAICQELWRQSLLDACLPISRKRPREECYGTDHFNNGFKKACAVQAPAYATKYTRNYVHQNKQLVTIVRKQGLQQQQQQHHQQQQQQHQQQKQQQQQQHQQQQQQQQQREQLRFSGDDRSRASAVPPVMHQMTAMKDSIEVQDASGQVNFVVDGSCSGSSSQDISPVVCFSPPPSMDVPELSKGAQQHQLQHKQQQTKPHSRHHHHVQFYPGLTRTEPDLSKDSSSNTNVPTQNGRGLPPLTDFPSLPVLQELLKTLTYEVDIILEFQKKEQSRQVTPAIVTKHSMQAIVKLDAHHILSNLLHAPTKTCVAQTPSTTAGTTTEALPVCLVPSKSATCDTPMPATTAGEKTSYLEQMREKLFRSSIQTSCGLLR